MSENDRTANVVVIGGGAAGMMSAVAASEEGTSVLLLERNEKLGKKVFITGHGRCNVTNIADRQDFERKIFRNPRFMRSSLSRFTPEDLIEFLKKRRVPTKQEDSGRIFPASDKSSDVIRAFQRSLDASHVDVELNVRVRSVDCLKDGRFRVVAHGGCYTGTAVILATGGVSYPSTGSTGDGFGFAEHLGHTTLQPQAGLAGLVAHEPARELAGLTLGGAQIAISVNGKVVARVDGDVLFTHYGLSGPAAFRASCLLADHNTDELVALVSLAGNAGAEELDARLAAASQKNANSEIRSVVSEIVPKRLAPFVLNEAGIDANKRINQLTRGERRRIAETISAFPIQLDGVRPAEEAIITIGGVSTKEIKPSTMESKLVPGLFFAGELIDVSAYTGGYNLQIAFSSGWVAGKAAAEYARSRTGGQPSLRG